MTLHIGIILHIYQPPTQKPVVLKKIIKESYQPLFDSLIKLPYGKITFNINGSLLELLDLYQEEQLLENIKQLVARDQIDLVGPSCYHAILPLIPEAEIIRQIELNEKQHEKVLGPGIINSKGFWLPEMAFDNRVIDPLRKKEYMWTVVSSVATPTKELPDNYIPITNGDFSIYFRNDLLSNLISFKHPSVEEFYQELTPDKNLEEDSYLILAMDGETFGHHVQGLIEDFLVPLIQKFENDSAIELVKINDLSTIYSERKNIIARSSSWSTTEEDIQLGIPLPLWSDPTNHVHNLQLSVMNHTLYLVTQAQNSYQECCEKDQKIIEKFANARKWLDQGLHSCQLWWASKRPWYSAEMILKGLNQLILASSEALKVIFATCQDEEEKNKALKIFDEIFDAQKEIYLTV